MNTSKKTNTVTKLGILGAISIVLVAILHFPIIPAVSFLEYDPADIPILLATFALGPASGFALTVVVAVIQGLTVSSASSWYGMLMHILATGTYVAVSGNIYKKHKTKKAAITALLFGTLAWVLVMIPANLFLTPIYLQSIVGLPKDIAVAAVPPLLGWIVLFNLIKAGINSIITFFVYKRVSPLLHK